MSNETTLDDVLALVPCPFCGWQVTNADVEHLEGTILHPAYRVCCPHCGASTEYIDHDHRKDWNNRVLTLPPDWHPTPEAINALPQPLRDYIHTIQTSHPSYDNAVKVKLLEEKVAMLERALGEGWQPIETAPKDGRSVLVADYGDPCGFEANWVGDKSQNYWGETGWFYTDDNVLTSHPQQPDVWMELPTPPRFAALPEPPQSEER